MSTLRLTTISNQSGSASVPSDTVINGSAKAWVNFNGTGTVAIRASFNVSSITDNGTGNYTVNFTTAFANTNYCVVSSNVHEPGVAVWDIAYRTDSITTSSVGVQSMNTVNTSAGDSLYLTIAIFR